MHLGARPAPVKTRCNCEACRPRGVARLLQYRTARTRMGLDMRRADLVVLLGVCALVFAACGGEIILRVDEGGELELFEGNHDSNKGAGTSTADNAGSTSDHAAGSGNDGTENRGGEGPQEEGEYDGYQGYGETVSHDGQYGVQFPC